MRTEELNKRDRSVFILMRFRPKNNVGVTLDNVYFCFFAGIRPVCKEEIYRVLAAENVPIPSDDDENEMESL